MTREEWIIRFVKALVFDLRPDIGIKPARAAAANEYPQHKDEPPTEAAQRWANLKKS